MRKFEIYWLNIDLDVALVRFSHLSDSLLNATRDVSLSILLVEITSLKHSIYIINDDKLLELKDSECSK